MNKPLLEYSISAHPVPQQICNLPAGADLRNDRQANQEILCMSVTPFNVLFLCAGNSARSIMAEAYLNAAGMGRFVAYSAGSHPAGAVNPFALELVRKNRIDTSGLRSKGWEEFARAGAPALDFVFTVCDNAAGEVCPIWPGQPMTAQLGHRRSGGGAGE